MSSPEKPPQAGGIPSAATIANAVERLERAQFKLGKVMPRAIKSNAAARADKAELDAAQAEADSAREDLEALVARATAPENFEQSLQAVREKMVDGGRIQVLPHGEKPPITIETPERGTKKAGLFTVAEPVQKPDGTVVDVMIAKPLGPNGPDLRIETGRPALTEGPPLTPEPQEADPISPLDAKAVTTTPTRKHPGFIFGSQKDEKPGG